MKLFFLLSLAASNVWAATVNFDAALGKTEFFAVGKPAMIKINGEGKGPTGAAQIAKDLVQLNVKVDLKSLTTKIDLRDDHMKNKYLEVAQYPEATLEIKDLKLSEDLEKAKEKTLDVPFKGQLTLRGITKPVEGTAKVIRKDGELKGNAEFTIKVMEYLSTLPSWAGIKVAEDVKIKVQFQGLIQ